MAKRRVDRGIYELDAGVYEVAVSAGRQPDGTYRQVFRRHHGSLASSRKFRRALLAEVAAGSHTGSGATVDELFDAWLVDLARLGRAPKTINGYRDDANRYWHPAIGSKRIAKVERADIRRVLDDLTARGLAPSTLDHVHACVSAAFSWAVNEGWLVRDVTKGIPLPERAAARPVVPTPDDVIALLDAAAASPRPEMERFVWLGAILGARSSELRALRLPALHLDDGLIEIDRALSAEVEWPTKNRRQRDIRIDPTTVQVIAEQIAFMRNRASAADADLDDDAYLLSDDLHGRKPWREDMVTRFLSALADETNGRSRFTFKDLRKFMDTHGQALGFTVDDVADRAGHTPAVARRHYTGARAATDQRLSTELAGLLERRRPPHEVVSDARLETVELATGVRVDRAKLDAFCRANSIRRLRLFGSALRDQLDADSDIDLLVEFDPDQTPGLLTMAILELELGELLGRDVDLRTPGDLSPYFRDNVTSHARLLYAAA